MQTLLVSSPTDHSKLYKEQIFGDSCLRYYAHCEMTGGRNGVSRWNERL